MTKAPFQIFGLTPVFENGQLFFERLMFKFTDDKGEVVEMHPWWFFMHLVKNDKIGSVFTSDMDREGICREYLVSFRVWIQDWLTIRTALEFKQHTPGNIKDTINEIAQHILSAYLDPIYQTEIEFHTTVEVLPETNPDHQISILLLSELDRIKFNLNRFSTGFQGGLQPEELAQDLRARSKQLLIAISVYVESFYITTTSIKVNPYKNIQSGSYQQLNEIMDICEDLGILGAATVGVFSDPPQKENIKKKRKKASAKPEPGAVKAIGEHRKSGLMQQFELTYYKPHTGKKNLKVVQAELWGRLQDETKANIQKAGYQESVVTEGANLTGSETKFINCICKLLHYKSESTDTRKPGHYEGSELIEVPYGNTKSSSPKLTFTLYELTKEYISGGGYLDRKITGDEIEGVRRILERLAEKKFLFSYERKIPKVGGGFTRNKIETFSTLFAIAELSQVDLTQDETEIEGTAKKETAIWLHPIFRDQIDSNFIIYPSDFNRRLMIAFGKSDVSDAAAKLAEWIMKEKSFKHQVAKLDTERLYWMLCEKLMKRGNKSIAKTQVQKAINTVLNMGTVLEYREEDRRDGPISIFTLDLDWPRTA